VDGLLEVGENGLDLVDHVKLFFEDGQSVLENLDPEALVFLFHKGKVDLIYA